MEDKESRILYEKAYDELLRRCDGDAFESNHYKGRMRSLEVTKKDCHGKLHRAFIGSDILPWRPCLAWPDKILKDSGMDWKECVVKVFLEVAEKHNAFALASSQLRTEDLVVMKKGESLESLLVWADLMDGKEQDGR